jgi:hypothetical protein
MCVIPRSVSRKDLGHQFYGVCTVRALLQAKRSNSSLLREGRPEDEKERAVHDATAEVVLSVWQEDGESTLCVLSLRPDAAPASRPEMKMLEELALQRDQVGTPHASVINIFKFTISNFFLFRRQLKIQQKIPP